MSSMKNLDALFAAYPEKNKTEPGTLYLTATPIGNTMDITARALKILSEVSFVAAEDTRNTGRLLAFYGIDKPLVSYFEHNKRQRGIMICDRLAKGESCALVTDAGMPAISDPGKILFCSVSKGRSLSAVFPGVVPFQRLSPYLVCQRDALCLKDFCQQPKENAENGCSKLPQSTEQLFYMKRRIDLREHFRICAMYWGLTDNWLYAGN